MKAVVCKQYGSPNVLNLIEVDKPSPGPNQILIRQKATTINSGDVRIRKADPFLVRLAFGITRPKFPILGMVVSGIVEQVGSSVTNFAPGDEVFGINEKTFGCNAEYVVVNDNIALTKKPKGMSFEDAAAIVFGGHTALHFLRKADVQKGQTILIYGASGSVGTAIIQIAKHFGAVVTAVCSKENIPLVKSLGADQAIDYTSTEIADIKNQYDIVIETVNKTKVSEIAKLVKPDGKLILIAAIIKAAIQGLIESKKSKINLILGTASVTSKDLDYLKKLIESKGLKPAIDKTFTLAQIREAHEYVDGGHKKGNVVIKI